MLENATAKKKPRKKTRLALTEPPVQIQEATTPQLALAAMIDARDTLHDAFVSAGMTVLGAMLEERAKLCGPRYAHQPARVARRSGHADGELALGGQRVRVRRRRVHGVDGREVKTREQLAELMSRDLGKLALCAIMIDGIHVDEHLVLAALGIDEHGDKHPLGLYEGATENTTSCLGLLSDPIGPRAPTPSAPQATSTSSPCWP